MNDADAAITSLAADEVIREEFKKFGYYTVDAPITVVLTDSDGEASTPITTADLGIIFINSAVCDNANYALMKHNGDPGDQLYFLETELLQAETDAKVMWIVGNLPPGSPTCNGQWAERYNLIIERF